MPSDEKSRRKIGAIIILIVILGPLAYWAATKFMVSTRLALLLRAPVEKKFADAWASDLKHLESAKALPADFHDLRKIRISCTTPRLREIAKKYPLTLPTNPRGKYVLEIFMDQIDGGGVMVQYDLVDAKSGNTVWELGRTFPHNLGNAK